METLILWNPSAGSTQGAAELRERLTHQHSLQIYNTESRNDAIDRVIKACEDGVERLVAAGGDGTVNSVVEGMIRSGQTRSHLAILPLGTGNDLARSLKLDLNPDVALEQWSLSRLTPMDVVQLTTSEETRWYTNMLTGGNTGLYLDHLTDEVKQRWGPFCYLRGVVELLQQLEVFQLTVTLDDQPELTCKALNIFVANGCQSGGGLPVCPQAEVDDGLMDLVVVRDGSSQEIASLTTDYLIADYLKHDLIEFHQASSIQLTSDPPMPLTTDGDVVGETPIQLQLLSNAISVLVPSESDLDS